MKLPDTNVLVYAVNEDAAQHGIARRWVETAFSDSRGVGLAWVSLLGFLRITTRAGIMRQPLTVEGALGVMQEWLDHPKARLVNPGPRHPGLLARLLVGAGAAGNLTNDAHLAALAIEHGATVASFDRDFRRFAGLDLEWLGPGGS